VAPERSVQKEVMQSIDPQHTNGTMEGTDSIERLEERATIAKRDAQSKQTLIPRFVQKLSR
jgi:heat shock transcription factor